MRRAPTSPCNACLLLLPPAAMVSTSDVPDWCWAKACGVPATPGGSAATPGGPTLEALSRMWEASPLRYVTEAAGSFAPRAAVLLIVGLRDRRVPPSQSIEYYHALRAARPGGTSQNRVRLLAYPSDSHALKEPASEADGWVNTALWLLTHNSGAMAAAQALWLH